MKISNPSEITVYPGGKSIFIEFKLDSVINPSIDFSIKMEPNNNKVLSISGNIIKLNQKVFYSYSRIKLKSDAIFNDVYKINLSIVSDQPKTLFILENPVTFIKFYKLFKFFNLSNIKIN